MWSRFIFTHRYQATAAAKWLGGADYRYALRTDSKPVPFEPLPAEAQRRALQALLATLDPEWLLLPESVCRLIPPKAYGYRRDRESPGGYTGVQLDPVSLAEAAAQHTYNLLLQPERLARLALQSASDNAAVSVTEVFDGLFARCFGPAQTGLSGMIQRRNGAALLAHWRRLVTAAEVSPEVRAGAHAALSAGAQWLGSQQGARSETAQFYRYQLWLIEQFMAHPDAEETLMPRTLPPGSPIG